VELNSDLLKRLGGLQLPADTIEYNLANRNDDHPLEDSSSRSPTLIPGTTAIRRTSNVNGVGNLESLQEDTFVESSFNVVLATIRVYNRVEGREIDAMTSVSTTRSHAWSALSNLSLSALSIIAVIKLPLHESDLLRFKCLVLYQTPTALRSTSTAHDSIDRRDDEGLLIPDKDFLKYYGVNYDPVYYSGGGANLPTMRRELSDMINDPPPYGIAAGPIDDGMVRVDVLY
jgi:hypothetical protein